MDADTEFVCYHFALHNFSWEPSKWLTLNRKEKALVIASIKVEMERRKKENARLSKK